MREVIVNVVIALTSILVLGVISNVCLLLSNRVEKLKAEAKAENKKGLVTAFTAAEVILDSVVNATVGKIEQVKAGELRVKVKNGEIPYDELKILAQDAYYEIIETVKPDVMAAINDVVEDSETYIHNKIEDAVRKVKLEASNNSTEGS